MSVDILKEARTMGVQLYLSNNKLKVRANKGALTSELRAKIVDSKEDLIRLLQELESVSDSADSDTINPVGDRAQGLPLSFAQQRMWFVDQLEENSAQYNIPMALKLTGDLNLEAFQAAMNDLVARHEILRTTYSKTEQGPVQFVNPPRPVLINQEDLTHISSDEQQVTFKAMAKAEADKPFDLNKDLMLRVTLFTLADNQFNLLFTLHHIAADGWSMGLLARDFGALYKARLQATDSGLPVLDVQYADFANWQRERLDGDNIEAQFDFWQAQLKELPELHSLPLDFPRPVQQSFDGGSHMQLLSPELTSRLNDLAIKSGTTLYVLLRCALAVLLSRWSNEQDIVIAGPVAGRTNAQIEELIGCFINTLVFRHKVEPNTPFDEFLKSANEVSLQCMDNQDIQFDQLVERLQPERSLAYSPLFQIIFTFQNNEAAHMELPGLQLEAVDENEKVIRFDLQLTATESAQGINCDWRYVTKLFSAQSITRLAAAYETLLNGIVDNTQSELAALPLISASEQLQLQSLMAANGGAEELSKTTAKNEALVPALFAQYAKANPQQLAVADDTTELTYAQLDAKANQLAHALLAQGIDNNVPVAICVERSAATLVAILATWKAGAAYLPLASEHPVSRLKYQLQDSGCQLLLTQSGLVSELGTSDIKSPEKNTVTRIELDDAQALSAFADTAPEVDIKPEQLAYVIYTSGSTGKAKGVCVEHRNLAHLASNMDAILDAPKTWGWMASYVFDASLQAISRIAYGTAISIFTSPHKLEARVLTEFLTHHQADLLDCTPSMVEAWFELGLESQLPNLVIGGEPVSVSLWNKLVSWQARFGRQAFNVYGPTECCVNATWTRIAGEQPHIGRALGGNQLRVVAKDGQLQPIGVAGELLISGPGVARGYLSRKALTDEKFITLDGQRCYQTGDLVRWTSEGNLEFIKRADDQLKVRGYRVEPGEIESALTNNLGIREAMVLQNLDDQGNKRNDLTAYCLVDAQSAPAASRILTMLDEERIASDDLIEVPNGMAICGVNKSETLSIYDEIFVANVYERHGVKIEEGQVIFDVGANIGVFGTSLTTRFDALQVYSFEPIPDIYRRLEANAEIYGNERNHIHCMGLSDQPKSTEFDYYPYNTALSGISKDEAAPLQVVKQYMLNTNMEKGIVEEQVEDFVQERLEKRKVKVQLSTVSEQIRKYGVSQIDLLKIDVERSELDVLLGIEDADWPKIKQVVIEVHDEDGALATIEAMLNKHGFDVFVDEEQELKDTGLYNIFAIRSGEREYTPNIVRNDQKWRSANTLNTTLQDNLTEQLPEYMVPKSIVLMNQYPLTQNGKVDKKCLSSMTSDASQEEADAAPRTPLEATLCDIWQNLLKVDNLSIHDNFFARGGDSILSIQAVARAKKAGIDITTRQLFDKQTIAELAKVANTTDSSDAHKPGVGQKAQQASGTLQLLPIQKQFFSEDAEAVNHFNQWLLLTTPQGFSAEKMRQLCEVIYQQHDVLRLRFNKSKDNWQASYAPYSNNMLEQSIAIEALPEDRGLWSQHITARCQVYQRSLDIVNGPLFKLIYLDGGEHGEGRLFMVAHHLIVDGVSWRILLEDIEAAYGQLQQGQTISLSPKTTSFQQWSNALVKAANDGLFEKEMDYWLSQQNQTVPALSFDVNSDEKATYATTQRASLRLDTGNTEGLLKQCSAAYGTKINELLLSAVYLALSNWQQQKTFMLTLEGHGREDLFSDIDTSQTMGWFTSAYPLVLRSEDDSIGGVIKAIKDQYRAIPNNGIGYGVLCELSEQPTLATPKHAEIAFNYLGQFDQSVNTKSAFTVAPEHTGDAIDPQRMRPHGIGFTGMVAGGELEFIIDFSTQQFSQESMDVLANMLNASLKDVVSHCRNVNKTVLTCSDFPLSTLPQTQLDILQEQYSIEDLYPATPMQKGMVFHSAMEASAYVSQITLTFNGDLKTDLFRKAWESAIAKYPIFRTALVSSGENLHQLVNNEVQLDWHQDNWSDLGVQDKHTRFTQYQRQDKAKGFDLTQAPLMRLAVFELAPRRSQLLWSFHHTIMDGWCTPLVYKEVMSTYQALLQGQSVPEVAAVPYKDYIQWLTTQDQQQALNYWREYLDGFTQPTPLMLDKIAFSEEQGYRKQSLDLGKSFTAELEQFARSNNTTVNTLLQLGLGLLLQTYSGNKDAVFGATISGRPAQVAGIESMVGMFINSVPVRINPRQQLSVIEAARDLQTQFNDSNHFGYVGLTDIQQQTAIKGNLSLFDVLMAFENYPIDAQESVNAEKLPLTVEGLESDEQTNYGLTFIITLKDSLVINCGYNVDRFANSSVGMMLNHFSAVLQQLMTVKKLSEISFLSGEEAELFSQVHSQVSTACRSETNTSETNTSAAEENVASEHSEACSATEQKLKGIWEATLPLPVVSVHSNFFDLGGNSLLALQVAEACQAQGLNVHVALIWKHQTIAAVAQALEEAL